MRGSLEAATEYGLLKTSRSALHTPRVSNELAARQRPSRSTRVDLARNDQSKAVHVGRTPGKYIYV